ncbi:MAG: acetyl-CoA carboxylase biotin carboxyl carrier protein subunit [Bacteroidales bacterium]|nr:acetyl-CoA carboxylase biotin carboxyl carrier protein subunit [Bacteroidales bacterium]
MNILFKSSDSASTIKYITISDKSKFEVNISPENIIKVNKKVLNVQIEEGTDGFTYIVLGNLKYPMEILERSQNKYTILINGVSYKFTVETPISFNRKKHLEKILDGSKKEDVLAPMPGKIIELLAEEGAAVKENDPLLILEAMKMENEIRTHVSGIVKKINIKPGDTVMKDDVLMEIENNN